MAGFEGFDKIREVSQEISERKNANSGAQQQWALELWTGLRNSGDSVTVRFLEQGKEISAGWMHEYKDGNVRKYFPCLDAKREGVPCPGCEDGLKLTVRGHINLIWRNAPVLARDEDGRAKKDDASGKYIIDHYEDQVATWSQGITVFERLAECDEDYRGLRSRDFKITRKGLKLDTKYQIDPALDEEGNANATPMSDADEALAEKKYDIKSLYLPDLTYDETAALFRAGSAGGVTPESVSRESAFGGAGRGSKFLKLDD